MGMKIDMDKIVQQDSRGRVNLGPENANKLFLARQERNHMIAVPVDKED